MQNGQINNQMENYRYIVVKNYIGKPYGYGDFVEEPEDSKTLFVLNDDNLTDCIKAIHLDIISDDNKYEMGTLKFDNCDEWQIEYELVIFKDKDCGWNDRITVYQCWIDLDEEIFRCNIETHKIFDIYKNNNTKNYIEDLLKQNIIIS